MEEPAWGIHLKSHEEKKCILRKEKRKHLYKVQTWFSMASVMLGREQGKPQITDILQFCSLDECVGDGYKRNYDGDRYK